MFQFQSHFLFTSLKQNKWDYDNGDGGSGIDSSGSTSSQKDSDSSQTQIKGEINDSSAAAVDYYYDPKSGSTYPIHQAPIVALVEPIVELPRVEQAPIKVDYYSSEDIIQNFSEVQSDVAVQPQPFNPVIVQTTAEHAAVQHTTAQLEAPPEAQPEAQIATQSTFFQQVQQRLESQQVEQPAENKVQHLDQHSVQNSVQQNAELLSEAPVDSSAAEPALHPVVDQIKATIVAAAEQPAAASAVPDVVVNLDESLSVENFIAMNRNNPAYQKTIVVPGHYVSSNEYDAKSNNTKQVWVEASTQVVMADLSREYFKLYGNPLQKMAAEAAPVSLEIGLYDSKTGQPAETRLATVDEQVSIMLGNHVYRTIDPDLVRYMPAEYQLALKLYKSSEQNNFSYDNKAGDTAVYLAKQLLANGITDLSQLKLTRTEEDRIKHHPEQTQYVGEELKVLKEAYSETVRMNVLRLVNGNTNQEIIEFPAEGEPPPAFVSYEGKGGTRFYLSQNPTTGELTLVPVWIDTSDKNKIIAVVGVILAVVTAGSSLVGSISSSVASTVSSVAGAGVSASTISAAAAAGGVAGAGGVASVAGVSAAAAYAGTTAAISGFVSGTATSLLSGQSLGDAIGSGLRSGVTGALTAGITQGIAGNLTPVLNNVIPSNISNVVNPIVTQTVANAAIGVIRGQSLGDALTNSALGALGAAAGGALGSQLDLGSTVTSGLSSLGRALATNNGDITSETIATIVAESATQAAVDDYRDQSRRDELFVASGIADAAVVSQILTEQDTDYINQRGLATTSASNAAATSLTTSSGAATQTVAATHPSGQPSTRSGAADAGARSSNGAPINGLTTSANDEASGESITFTNITFGDQATIDRISSQSSFVTSPLSSFGQAVGSTTTSEASTATTRTEYAVAQMKMPEVTGDPAIDQPAWDQYRISERINNSSGFATIVSTEDVETTSASASADQATTGTGSPSITGRPADINNGQLADNMSAGVNLGQPVKLTTWDRAYSSFPADLQNLFPKDSSQYTRLMNDYNHVLGQGEVQLAQFLQRMQGSIDGLVREGQLQAADANIVLANLRPLTADGNNFISLSEHRTNILNQSIKDVSSSLQSSGYDNQTLQSLGGRINTFINETPNSRLNSISYLNSTVEVLDLNLGNLTTLRNNILVELNSDHLSEERRSVLTEQLQPIDGQLATIQSDITRARFLQNQLTTINNNLVGVEARADAISRVIIHNQEGNAARNSAIQSTVGSYVAGAQNLAQTAVANTNHVVNENITNFVNQQILAQAAAAESGQGQVIQTARTVAEILVDNAAATRANENSEEPMLGGNGEVLSPGAGQLNSASREAEIIRTASQLISQRASNQGLADFLNNPEIRSNISIALQELDNISYTRGHQIVRTIIGDTSISAANGLINLFAGAAGLTQLAANIPDAYGMGLLRITQFLTGEDVSADINAIKTNGSVAGVNNFFNEYINFDKAKQFTNSYLTLHSQLSMSQLQQAMDDVRNQGGGFLNGLYASTNVLADNPFLATRMAIESLGYLVAGSGAARVVALNILERSGLAVGSAEAMALLIRPDNLARLTQASLLTSSALVGGQTFNELISKNVDADVALAVAAFNASVTLGLGHAPRLLGVADEGALLALGRGGLSATGGSLTSGVARLAVTAGVEYATEGLEEAIQNSASGWAETGSLGASSDWGFNFGTGGLLALGQRAVAAQGSSGQVQSGQSQIDNNNLNSQISQPSTISISNQFTIGQMNSSLLQENPFVSDIRSTSTYTFNNNDPVAVALPSGQVIQVNLSGTINWNTDSEISLSTTSGNPIVIPSSAVLGTVTSFNNWQNGLTAVMQPNANSQPVNLNMLIDDSLPNSSTAPVNGGSNSNVGLSSDSSDSEFRDEQSSNMTSTTSTGASSVDLSDVTRRSFNHDILNVELLEFDARRSGFLQSSTLSVEPELSRIGAAEMYAQKMRVLNESMFGKYPEAASSNGQLDLNKLFSVMTSEDRAFYQTHAASGYIDFELGRAAAQSYREQQMSLIQARFFETYPKSAGANGQFDESIFFAVASEIDKARYNVQLAQLFNLTLIGYSQSSSSRDNVNNYNFVREVLTPLGGAKPVDNQSPAIELPPVTQAEVNDRLRIFLDKRNGSQSSLSGNVLIQSERILGTIRDGSASHINFSSFAQRVLEGNQVVDNSGIILNHSTAEAGNSLGFVTQGSPFINLSNNGYNADLVNRLAVIRHEGIHLQNNLTGFESNPQHIHIRIMSENEMKVEGYSTGFRFDEIVAHQATIASFLGSARVMMTRLGSYFDAGHILENQKPLFDRLGQLFTTTNSFLNVVEEVINQGNLVITRDKSNLGTYAVVSVSSPDGTRGQVRFPVSSNLSEAEMLAEVQNLIAQARSHLAKSIDQVSRQFDYFQSLEITHRNAYQSVRNNSFSSLEEVAPSIINAVTASELRGSLNDYRNALSNTTQPSISNVSHVSDLISQAQENPSKLQDLFGPNRIVIDARLQPLHLQENPTIGPVKFTRVDEIPIHTRMAAEANERAAFLLRSPQNIEAAHREISYSAQLLSNMFDDVRLAEISLRRIEQQLSNLDAVEQGIETRNGSTYNVRLTRSNGEPYLATFIFNQTVRPDQAVQAIQSQIDQYRGVLNTSIQHIIQQTGLNQILKEVYSQLQVPSTTAETSGSTAASFYGAVRVAPNPTGVSAPDTLITGRDLAYAGPRETTNARGNELEVTYQTVVPQVVQSPANVRSEVAIEVSAEHPTNVVSNSREVAAIDTGAAGVNSGDVPASANVALANNSTRLPASDDGAALVVAPAVPSEALPAPQTAGGARPDAAQLEVIDQPLSGEIAIPETLQQVPEFEIVRTTLSGRLPQNWYSQEVMDYLIGRLGTSSRVGDFTNLTGASIEEVVSRIPFDARVEDSSLPGLRFKFNLNGETYVVRFHNSRPSDQADIPGSNAAGGQVLRVEISVPGNASGLRRQYFEQDDLGNRIAVTRSSPITDQVTNSLHIPLAGNTNLMPGEPRGSAFEIDLRELNQQMPHAPDTLNSPESSSPTSPQINSDQLSAADQEQIQSLMSAAQTSSNDVPVPGRITDHQGYQFAENREVPEGYDFSLVRGLNDQAKYELVNPTYNEEAVRQIYSAITGDGNYEALQRIAINNEKEGIITLASAHIQVGEMKYKVQMMSPQMISENPNVGGFVDPANQTVWINPRVDQSIGESYTVHEVGHVAVELDQVNNARSSIISPDESIKKDLNFNVKYINEGFRFDEIPRHLDTAIVLLANLRHHTVEFVLDPQLRAQAAEKINRLLVETQRIIGVNILLSDVMAHNLDDAMKQVRNMSIEDLKDYIVDKTEHSLYFSIPTYISLTSDGSKKPFWYQVVVNPTEDMEVLRSSVLLNIEAAKKDLFNLSRQINQQVADYNNFSEALRRLLHVDTPISAAKAPTNEVTLDTRTPSDISEPNLVRGPAGSVSVITRVLTDETSTELSVKDIKRALLEDHEPTAQGQRDFSSLSDNPKALQILSRYGLSVAEIKKLYSEGNEILVETPTYSDVQKILELKKGELEALLSNRDADPREIKQVKEKIQETEADLNNLYFIAIGLDPDLLSSHRVLDDYATQRQLERNQRQKIVFSDEFIEMIKTHLNPGLNLDNYLPRIGEKVRFNNQGILGYGTLINQEGQNLTVKFYNNDGTLSEIKIKEDDLILFDTQNPKLVKDAFEQHFLLREGTGQQRDQSPFGTIRDYLDEVVAEAIKNPYASQIALLKTEMQQLLDSGIFLFDPKISELKAKIEELQLKTRPLMFSEIKMFEALEEIPKDVKTFGLGQLKLIDDLLAIKNSRTHLSKQDQLWYEKLDEVLSRPVTNLNKNLNQSIHEFVKAYNKPGSYSFGSLPQGIGANAIESGFINRDQLSQLETLFKKDPRGLIYGEDRRLVLDCKYLIKRILKNNSATQAMDRFEGLKHIVDRVMHYSTIFRLEQELISAQEIEQQIRRKPKSS